MNKSIQKLLIANRGEIAVRIMRACRDLGIVSVAVYSECDAAAYHVRMADEAYAIGPSPSSESYLVADKIIGAAKESGADAIHPGYGFLSENVDFSRRCQDEGIIFIGPHANTIGKLGDKLVAREMAVKAVLPVVPGTDISKDNLDKTKAEARRIGYPVLIKAAAGGGGKGMRIVQGEEELEESIQRAASEAESAFADGRVFMEKYLVQPRHIEIQILSDSHGNHLYLGERECSIQRRHQKVIEESPSPFVDESLRKKMGKAAISIAKQADYLGAGTVEFLVDQDRSYYFLEVNTRLQVEHPVTEMVTGFDLVKEQIAIAEGKPLSHRQEDIKINGHALECRIYAEDPEEGFMPSTGTLQHYRLPAGPGVRVDSGVVIFSEVPIHYDPLIAKLVTWGTDRREAIRRMDRALEEYRISGVKTTIGFHRELMNNQRFNDGNLSTEFLNEEYPDNHYVQHKEDLREKAAIAAVIDRFLSARKISVGKDHDLSRSSNWTRMHRRKNLRQFGGSR
jgi:propionyl-CoA carboxylase alpha chain